MTTMFGKVFFEVLRNRITCFKEQFASDPRPHAAQNFSEIIL